MIYQKCRVCNGTGKILNGEQCLNCYEGLDLVETRSLFQHKPYLVHLIDYLPTCEEAGCVLEENAHDELCVIADVLVSLRNFLAIILANEGKCPHDPMVNAGKPMGMYHCPECGEMIVAGMAHT